MKKSKNYGLTIGELPDYSIRKELKTKTEIVIYNKDYSVKVDKLIEILGIKKRETDRVIIVWEGIKKKDKVFPLLILSPRDYKKVKEYLLELDKIGNLEPIEYLRNKRLNDVLSVKSVS
jgi:hypothetical protein